MIDLSDSPLTAARLGGPLRVLAGPGTGKTRTLVELYAELVERDLAGRDQVLVLTFSTAAAGEIASRLDHRLQDSYGTAWISTFHSFCARLLREHRPDPAGLLMSGFQEWLAMRSVLAGLDPGQLGPLAAVRHTEAFAQDVLGVVALLKQNLNHPGPFALLAETSGTDRLRVLAAIYSAYQARLDATGLRDFRDLVADSIGLLDARPDLLRGLQERFRYVLVDEFQDVDPAQFELLRRLAPPAASPRLLVVGDPDQSIYGFRGTVPQLLNHDFEPVYGGASAVLGVSRRCPADVLTAADRLLAVTQPGRGLRGLRSDRSGAGTSLRVVHQATAVEEATFVARETRRLLLEDPGLEPGQVAILLRSTSTLAAPFEEALRALGVDFELRGAGAIARNEVVRFLVTYLQALHAPDDPASLERVMASGLSGVPHRTSGRLRRHAVEEGRAFSRVVHHLCYHLAAADPGRHPLPWGGGPPEPGGRDPDYLVHLGPEELDAVHSAVSAFHRLAGEARRLPVRALAHAVLVEAGVLGRLLSEPIPECDRRAALADLRAALEALADMEAVGTRLTGAPPTLAEVAGRLPSLLARAVDDAQPAAAGRAAVQVMTVHQSKGLEFRVVFLAGFAQGLFPLDARPHPLLDEADRGWLERSLPGFRPSWPSDPEAHAQEEARLAYVGMTRASERLYLTFAAEYEGPAGPSPFLELALPGPVPPPAPAAAPRRAADVLTLGEAEAMLAGLELSASLEARLAGLGVDLGFVGDPEAGLPFEPQSVPPAGVDPGHFSPTSLNDYLRCPRLYWYNHHPGLAAPPRGVEMERGSFIHQVLEEFHQREDEWRDLSAGAKREWLDGVLEQHLERYLGDVGAVLERRAEEQEVRRILGNYIDFATANQVIRRLGTIATEKKFFLEVDGAEVRGKIDRIIDTGEGTCEVVDYKTGRGAAAQKTYERYFGPQAHDIQLAMYELACRQGVDGEGNPLALRPRFLSLWYPKDVVYGSMRQVLFPLAGVRPGVPERMQRPVSGEDLERGRERVREAIRRIRAGDFAPQPRADAIGTCLSWYGCPHATICPFGGQPQE